MLHKVLILTVSGLTLCSAALWAAEEEKCSLRPFSPQHQREDKIRAVVVLRGALDIGMDNWVHSIDSHLDIPDLLRLVCVARPLHAAFIRNEGCYARQKPSRYRIITAFTAHNFQQIFPFFIKNSQPDNTMKSLRQTHFYAILSQCHRKYLQSQGPGLSHESRRAFLESSAEGKEGYLRAQQELNKAAWKALLGESNQLGFTAASAEKYLEARAALKDQHAQRSLNNAALYRPTRVNNEERQTYLKNRAELGDQDAQQKLNTAALHGWLGFNDVSGRKHLEERAALKNQYGQQIDPDAQQKLNEAAQDRRLGFSGRKHLEARAALKDQHGQQIDPDAQQKLNEAARDGRLGFTADDWFGLVKGSGREYLEERAALKDQHGQQIDQDAQQKLNEAAVEGRLGFDNVGWFGFKSSGRKHLEERAALKDQHGQQIDQDAQQKLNDAALCGRLGFNDVSGRKHLEGRAKQGDRDAQQNLNEAALYGWLGFKGALRREYLEGRAAQGDQDAQQKLNVAAWNAYAHANTPDRPKLGFTLELGMKRLIKRIALGNKHATSLIMKDAGALPALSQALIHVLQDLLKN